MHRLFLVTLLLAAFALTGCFSHTYRTGHRPAGAEADYESWHHHVLFGLITLSDDVDLREVCPNGAAVIHNRQTFVNGLIGALTANIYTPTTVKVWCAAAGGDQAEMIEVEITEEMIETARLIYPDFDAQIMAIHLELGGTRVAQAD